LLLAAFTAAVDACQWINMTLRQLINIRLFQFGLDEMAMDWHLF
jgi:hypothetical protein